MEWSVLVSLGALEKLLVAASGGFGLSALYLVSDPCFGSPKATAPEGSSPHLWTSVITLLNMGVL